MRACIEFEANCKSIFTVHNYVSKRKNMNIENYFLIEKSHRLSGYRIKITHWREGEKILQPFSKWETSHSLEWYDTYNTTKHDRVVTFHEATFEKMLNAICGLLIILTAQFQSEDFSSPSYYLTGDRKDNFHFAIGKYFLVEYPMNWEVDERYGFNWESLKGESDPFQKFDYASLAKQSK